MMITAWRTEAALKTLRLQERLLHRMQFAVFGEALDGGDRTMLGAIGRKQARVHRLAIDHHGTGAAIAGVAAFFTPKQPSSRKNVRRHWPGRGVAAWVLPFTRKVMQSSHHCRRARFEFLRQIAASHAAATPVPRGGRCNKRRAESSASSLSRNAARDGRLANNRRTGRGVAAVTVSANAPSSGDSVPVRSAPERPSELKEIWRNAVRRRSAASGRSMARRSSPGRSALRCGAKTKSVTATRRSFPSGVQMMQTPSSAAVSEIIGPAGSAMQRLPPTVAAFQILNDARNERQHLIDERRGDPVGGKRRSVEFGDLAGRGYAQALFAHLQRAPAEIGDVDEPGDFQLRLGEQPSPTRKPGIAGVPRRQFGALARARNRGDGVDIHCVGRCTIHAAPARAQGLPGRRSLRAGIRQVESRCGDMS